MRFDSLANLEDDLQNGPIRKILTCPDDGEDQMSGNMNGQPNADYARVWSSYIVNQVLTETTSGRFGGKLTKARGSQEVVLVMDGLPRQSASDTVGHSFMHTSAFDSNRRTLADAYCFNQAGWPGNFDMLRHRGRIHVCMVDGHVEQLRLPKSRGPSPVSVNPSSYLTSGEKAELDQAKLRY
jgi:prepilin-type processing-associated H-X9-DG protein